MLHHQVNEGQGVEAGALLDGRYQVDGPLDQGGMGSIWKASEAETGETVAVKVLRLDAYTQGRYSPAERTRRRVEMLKRFEREGAILEELDHPAIPRLLHRGYHGEEPYLVMEYVDGDTLREFLDRRRPLPLDAACAIVAQVAEALSHAHTRGVVHRDLKPGNIVIAADGTVKLLDFGIAYLTDPDATRYTVLGATPGSAGYMAPEQLRGQQEVTAAVDLYALGCVFFELVTGQAPFDDKPDRNRDTQHIEDLPPRIQDINAGLPDELDELIWLLLAKFPAERPAGVEGLLPIVHRHLPVVGDPAPEPELDPDPTRRYRTPERCQSVADRLPASSARRSARRRRTWMGRQEFGGRVRQARAELDRDGPGPACERLAEKLARAVTDWGAREPVVSEAQLVCADAARLDGETRGAKWLYEQVVTALGEAEERTLREFALEARLGVAECIVPEGDVASAVSSWSATVADVLILDRIPDRLRARCHEVSLELVERGHKAEISALVTELEKR
ncbi:serine/threonine-protein kinase [Streptomyces sp. WAC 05379]|uniref:serine/threonine-protein kinase n=1 Tax=Streptomyces sp. WAC 05379 TaxID=2203207 RepID=UPI00163C08B0|nr:serine/threonine-protein kinase [Streptomyces sp. WAC 05379]